MNLKILNSKELKEIRRKIEEQYGITEKFPYVFLLSEKEDIYIINDEVKNIDLDKLNINTIGIYFGQVRNDFRPSLEGSQIIGKFVKKNILEVDDKVAKMWMYGLDIPCKEELTGYVIIKNKDNFLGSGRYKGGMILNFVPKGRRIHE